MEKLFERVSLCSNCTWKYLYLTSNLLVWMYKENGLCWSASLTEKFLNGKVGSTCIWHQNCKVDCIMHIDIMSVWICLLAWYNIVKCLPGLADLNMCILDANPKTYIYLFVTWNYCKQGDQAFNCLCLVLRHILFIWINKPVEISILSLLVVCGFFCASLFL